jgi:hypothetical protein
MAEEQKPREQIEMERAAEELERHIVRFTNIDKESFTHSFRGISTTVVPGASQVMRFPEADHLATHLARKILSRAKKAETRNLDRGVVLWTDKEVDELKSKILSEVGTETQTRVTPEEQHKIDQARLNKEYAPKKTAPKVTKKDVIKELESRGVKVDESKTLEELLKDLMDLEATG